MIANVYVCFVSAVDNQLVQTTRLLTKEGGCKQGLRRPEAEYDVV